MRASAGGRGARERNFRQGQPQRSAARGFRPRRSKCPGPGPPTSVGRNTPRDSPLRHRAVADWKCACSVQDPGKGDSRGSSGPAADRGCRCGSRDCSRCGLPTGSSWRRCSTSPHGSGRADPTVHHQSKSSTRRRQETSSSPAARAKALREVARRCSSASGSRPWRCNHSRRRSDARNRRREREFNTV